MSADLVIRCDAGDGLARCRNTYTAEGDALLAQARHEATALGWTHHATDGDRCPACTRRPHPADDLDRCVTCGRTPGQHNVRHPFRRLHLGRTRQEPRP